MITNYELVEDAIVMFAASVDYLEQHELDQTSLETIITQSLKDLGANKAEATYVAMLATPAIYKSFLQTWYKDQTIQSKFLAYNAALKVSVEQINTINKNDETYKTIKAKFEQES